MAEYKAKSGQQDRHGEMTGAITMNMMICMPVVAVWAIFIGPWLIGRWWVVALTAVLLAVVMPIVCMPLSRRVWAWISEWMDGGHPGAT